MGFRGGTGQSTPAGPAGGDLKGNYPNPTIGVLTTKGDILTRAAAASARVAVGADGGMLVADSSDPNGILWETAQYRLMSRTVIVQGTTTYTVPDDTRMIYVEGVGAGGGGGGAATAAASAAAGGGGGGGAYSAVVILAPKLTAFTVAVGAGGNAGANTGGNGGFGGDTSFDTGPNLLLAKGGSGGQGEAAGTAAGVTFGGDGGISGSGIGNVRLYGCPGGVGQRITGLLGFSGVGGAGAGAIGGGGGIAQSQAGAAGQVGGPFGGGGGGALVLNNSAAAVGGVGANGLLVVWEFA